MAFSLKIETYALIYEVGGGIFDAVDAVEFFAEFGGTGGAVEPLDLDDLMHDFSFSDMALQVRTGELQDGEHVFVVEGIENILPLAAGLDDAVGL